MSDAASAQPRTCQSMMKRTCSPLSPVERTASQSPIQLATRIAQAPPASASSSDSTIKGRSNCAREAPSADLTANSRARAIVRASRRLARFEQAIRSTKAERPMSIESMTGAVRPITVSLSGTARQVLPAFTCGKSVALRAPKFAIKRLPSAKETFPERRPITRRIVLLRSADFAWSKASGRKRSTQPRWRQSLKEAGITPTISCGSPSTRMTRPTMSALAAEAFLPKALTDNDDAIVARADPRSRENRARVQVGRRVWKGDWRSRGSRTPSRLAARARDRLVSEGV